MPILLATQEHLAEIVPLYRSLFSSVSALEPYFFKEADQDIAFLEATIEREDADIIVSVLDNVVVGFALIQLQETPPYNVYRKQTFAYLVDLITEPAHRGQGIASALLAECEVWAKQKNAEYLELSVLNKNTNAYNLYLKKGFSEKITTLYKPLN